MRRLLKKGEEWLEWVNEGLEKGNNRRQEFNGGRETFWFNYDCSNIHTVLRAITPFLEENLAI